MRNKALKPLPGIKEKLTFDVRKVRKSLMEVFEDLGGVERFRSWADEHYEKFILRVLVPLLPKNVDDEGLPLPGGGHGPVFDQEKFAEYLREARAVDVECIDG